MFDGERNKLAKIYGQDEKIIKFVIRPISIGKSNLTLSVIHNLITKRYEKSILVYEEGITKYKNYGFLINLVQNSVVNVKVPLDFPEDVIKNTELTTISCTGDILGLTIKNLDNLIEMSSGFIEQTIIQFVLNSTMLRYLIKTDQLVDHIELKAVKSLEASYQSLVAFKCNDGSFSVFGESNNIGSTWFTAFIIKSFFQAKDLITIDKHIIDCGFEFLISRQNVDGSFEELENFSHIDMHDGNSGGIALVAYVLSAFCESSTYCKKYSSNIANAVNYLVSNFDSTIDIYAHGILAYAIQLTYHSMGDSILNKFIARKQIKDELVWWEKQHCNHPSSVNIELTAYGLLALIQKGRVRECVPILKWLISQQNENGGFYSTQDTCVGIKAMTKLSKVFFNYNKNQNIDLTLEQDGFPTYLKIYKKKATMLQQIKVIFICI